MIVAIALLPSVGMSSMLGGSVSCRIYCASGIGVFSGGGGARSVCCWGLACFCRWAEFMSLVRWFICLVSAFVIGGRSCSGSVEVVCSAIGHIVCACLWYV